MVISPVTSTDRERETGRVERREGRGERGGGGGEGMELACLFYFHLLISYAEGKEDKHSDLPLMIELKREKDK